LSDGADKGYYCYGLTKMPRAYLHGLATAIHQTSGLDDVFFFEIIDLPTPLLIRTERCLLKLARPFLSS
jgi:hypothetical protein